MTPAQRARAQAVFEKWWNGPAGEDTYDWGPLVDAFWAFAEAEANQMLDRAIATVQKQADFHRRCSRNPDQDLGGREHNKWLAVVLSTAVGSLRALRPGGTG